MNGLPGERPPWANTMLHLADAMHRESRTWRLFGLTWAAAGFTKDEPLFERIRGHQLRLARFAMALDKRLSRSGDAEPQGVDEGPVIDEWQSLKGFHGNLTLAFSKEADRFAGEMKDKAGNWGTFTADLR
jgi:hypothetical protein